MSTNEVSMRAITTILVFVSFLLSSMAQGATRGEMVKLYMKVMSSTKVEKKSHRDDGNVYLGTDFKISELQVRYYPNSEGKILAALYTKEWYCLSTNGKVIWCDYENHEKSRVLGKTFEVSRNEGVKHRSFWQKMHDGEIRKLIRTIK